MVFLVEELHMMESFSPTFNHDQMRNYGKRFDVWHWPTYILSTEFLPFLKSAEDCRREVTMVVSLVHSWHGIMSQVSPWSSTTLSLSTLSCHQRHKNNIDTWWQSHHAVALLGFGHITRETRQILTNCSESGKTKTACHYQRITILRASSAKNELLTLCNYGLGMKVVWTTFRILLWCFFIRQPHLDSPSSSWFYNTEKTMQTIL